MSYLREYEHVTLAEVLLAHYRRDGDASVLAAARGLLDRLLDASVEGGRTATTLDVLVLQAIAAEADDDGGAALDALDRAVLLGEAEGHVRYAARHGAVVLPLLEAVAERASRSAYLDRLLTACRTSMADPGTEVGAAEAAVGRRTEGTSPVDPLSDRELEVLALLGSDLGGPEIARQLFISLNTLRTHTKSIYAKLGVSSRREAVRRGRELGLRTR